MPENKQTKKEWRKHYGKRILPLCQRRKGKSQRADIQSLLARKRTREVFRAGGQKKPPALFVYVKPHVLRGVQKTLCV